MGSKKGLRKSLQREAPFFTFDLLLVDQKANSPICHAKSLNCFMVTNELVGIMSEIIIQIKAEGSQSKSHNHPGGKPMIVHH